MHLAESVDLSLYVDRTAGFSGADLQAVIYNAHLEAVHASMPKRNLVPGNDASSSSKGLGLTYAEHDPTAEAEKVLSRAERTKVERKVSCLRGDVSLERC